MSKAIRWQIHFYEAKPASDNPKHYRIDIYDETGSWSGITQLTAGDNPFQTTEDNSDDFFCPVRSQTGTLQICTALPGGGMITLNDLLPANNIARPVIVSSIAANNTETIEWQGFLSCEAYSQDYTSIHENIDLPVISVLEAMASVELDMSLVKDIQQVRIHLYYILTELDRQCSMTNAFFSKIYYSRASSNFMMQYVDATILYDVNEYTNEENYTYVVAGMSCKDALERLCRYMGWVVREKSTGIYFIRINDELMVYEQLISNIDDSPTVFVNTRTPISYTSANLSEQAWRGANHKKSLTQGAKSVEVVANLKQYELEMGLPEIPSDSLQHYNAGVLEAWASMNDAYNNMLTFTYSEVTVRETSGGYDVFSSGDADIEDAFNDCVVSPDCDVQSQYPRKTNGSLYTCVKNCGAFPGRFNFSGQGQTNWLDGMYIVAVNEMQSTDHAPTVFKMDSLINYTLVDGTLRLKVTAITIVNDGTGISDFVGKAYLKLRFGSKYWNGSSWQAASTYFEADFSTTPEGEEPGTYILEIPITNKLTGSVTMEICGSIKGGTQYTNYFRPFYDILLLEFSLEHEEAEYVEKSDHTENKYYRLLGTNFRDEVSINTDLASTLNNRPSPSLVLQDVVGTAMRYMNYIINAGGTTEPRRPEVDLLNRLAAYYGAARQRLELEVAHPTAAPLPLLKLNGINDGKTYLPLSEQRDWRNDICKLTCFELPT